MRLIGTRSLWCALLLAYVGSQHGTALDLQPEGEGHSEEMVELHDIQGIPGEEEESYTREDISCSFMLMGMFFFTMVIFYLVNYPDDDIKRYSWSIINTTISIFCAVLIFSAADEVLISFVLNPLLGEFPRGWRQVGRVMVGYLLFIGWLIAAELMMACLARAWCHSTGISSQKQWVIHDHLRGDHGSPVAQEAIMLSATREKSVARIGQLEVFVTVEDLEREASERQIKCWSMLFAHMAGFAMISAGGDLQHSEVFVEHWFMSLVSVAANVAFLLLIFWISAKLRPRPDESDDSDDNNAPIELWNEHAIEAEDELFCLAISFLLVQALRFQVTGIMPTKTGLEPGKNFGAREIWTIYAEAVLFAVATVAVVLLGKTGRLADLTRGTLSMSFAWCLLFASRWMFESWPLLVRLNISPFSIEGRLVLSLFLSAFACSVIIVLDQIEDAATGDDRRVTHKIVKNIVTGLSILVGFTWETTMDGCTEAVVSMFHNHERRRLVSKIFGCCIILLVVLPAWRRYILHNVVKLMKYKKDQRAALKIADKLKNLDPKFQDIYDVDSDSSESAIVEPELTC